MAKGFFGRALDKIKQAFAPAPLPAPKPVPKRVPTTKPVRPVKSEAQKRAEKELMSARDKEKDRLKKARTDLVKKLEDLYGDRQNIYGEDSFNRTNVRKRVRNMPDGLVDQLSNLTTTDAIDLAYANSQTEFHGYDQPQGFWYH